MKEVKESRLVFAQPGEVVLVLRLPVKQAERLAYLMGRSKAFGETSAAVWDCAWHAAEMEAGRITLHDAPEAEGGTA